MIEGSRKKKKVDYEALSSSFMRIPNMDVSTARDLLDLGYQEYFELQGLSAQSLYDELQKVRTQLPNDRLKKLRMAVYYAENPGVNATVLEAAGEGNN